MEKSLFEQMGGTYSQIGDYLLPDLKIPEKIVEPKSADNHCAFGQIDRLTTYISVSKLKISFSFPKSGRKVPLH